MAHTHNTHTHTLSVNRSYPWGRPRTGLIKQKIKIPYVNMFKELKEAMDSRIKGKYENILTTYRISIKK